jgi:alanine racemase
VANSAAILDVPSAHFDLLRAGLALYGPEPVPGVTAGLRPAMTVRAVVVEVTSAGAAVLAVGAGQGTPGAVVGRGAVWLGGRRCPVRAVTLDRLVVDAPHASPGAGAVLFGPGTGGEPTAAQWAGWARTNPHEILTGFGARLPRRYVGGDQWKAGGVG